MCITKSTLFLFWATLSLAEAVLMHKKILAEQRIFQRTTRPDKYRPGKRARLIWTGPVERKLLVIRLRTRNIDVLEKLPKLVMNPCAGRTATAPGNAL